MDRFVTRTPTWKTLSYGDLVAQKNRSATNSKFTPSQTTPISKSTNLQSKQLSEFIKSQDFGSRLAGIFRATTTAASSDLPLAENLNSNSNDSGLSSASSISPPQPESAATASPLKKMQTPTNKKVLGKLGDYVDCPEEKENDTCMTLPRTPKSSKKATESKVKTLGLKENTPSKQILPQTPKVNKPITVQSATKTAERHTPSNQMLMARIQRDLDSPSASVRVRALRAVASPTKSPYTHFDIPEAEQSLNFSAVPEPPDIKDVMRNVIVYVEVRSGEDNRSEGVRKVIEALGARVNLKLLRDTTHVVFKDGLLSTFKKAQQWDIPVVSVLWIEACKTKNRICDPKEFPISNLDRYENPELYTKMKRFKYMQPDSEKFINRKVVSGGSAQKDLTPTQKTGATKKNSTLIGSTPTGSSNTKKKTDISQYFKKLDNSNRVLTTPIISVATTVAAADSPATILLNRISSNCYNTPWMQSENATTANKDNGIDNTKKKNLELYDEGSRESAVISDTSKTTKVKKSLNFFQSKDSALSKDDIKATSQNSVIDSPSSRTRRRSSISAALSATPSKSNATLENGAIQATHTPVKPPRRRSILLANEKEPNANDVLITPSKPPRRSIIATDKKMNPTGSSVTPSKKPNRRSSVHTPKNMTIETPIKDNNFQPIIEEDPTMEETQTESVAILAKSVNGKRTLHYSKPMEISDQSFKSHTGETCSNAIKENQPSASKSASRRTIYSCNSMNKTTVGETLDTTNVTTRRPTCYSVKSIETDTTQGKSWSTTKEKTNNMLAQKSVDLTNKILNLINKTSKSDQQDKTKQSAAAAAPKTHSNNRRRTLYTPKKSNENKTTHMVAAVAPQVSYGICITPTASSMTGKVVSSTFLESADKAKPIETPPATATTGKLLEETTECATPLVFSSSRQPGNRRRTLFDVSMDIITQRLQCINQSARRSLAPTPADKICTDTSTAIDTRKAILPDSDTESSATPRSSSSINNVPNEAAPDSHSPAVAIISKKRKLFVPNEILTPPPVVQSASNTTTLKTTNTSSVTKRRRTLVPLSQPIMSATLNSSDIIDESSTPVLKRRSTLDFEQIKNLQNKKAPVSMSNANNKLDVATAGGLQNGGELVKSKKKPVLVHTNMHKDQIDVINEAIDKLSHFNLEETVTDNTTHLVSLEPRRTMNLLRALGRGLWILDYTWVLESTKAGEWLPEEPYELRTFSRAIEICRSERQAFGDHYKCELFRDLGAFYISVRCYPITKDDLIELITLCGGRLTHGRYKARYIIGDTNPTLSDKLYITPYWVLDSISQMQIMKFQKYLVPMPGVRPVL